MSEDAPGAGDRSVVVLDYLPHGRADDDRPQYQKPPLAQALDTASFQLVELVIEEGEAVSIGDRLSLNPPPTIIQEVRGIDYGSLSGGARSELEHAVAEILDEDEERFVDFYNEAGPITLRLHQLNLLPGIGEKLRDNIIDARKREPFASLEELEERISGLHDPRGILIERIIEEIRDEDVKYKLLARPPE